MKTEMYFQAIQSPTINCVRQFNPKQKRRKYLFYRPFTTKRELLSTKSSLFVYPSRRLGISSRQRRGYHQGRRAALVSHQPLWGWILLRLDEIQHCVLMIYNSYGIGDIQGLRLDLSLKVWYNEEKRRG